MVRPEFPENTIFLLQKLIRDNHGREVQVNEGYTCDWDWAESWRTKASPYSPRFIIPVKKMEGAP